MAWFGIGKQDVDSLIARKQYGKAIEQVEAELRRSPRSVRLRQLLADLLARQGESERAVEILQCLADEFSSQGFVAKAVAVLKKIQRIAPGHPDVAGRLAELVKERRGGTGPPAAADVTTTAALPPEEEEAAAEGREAPAYHYSPLFSDLSESELTAVVGGLELRVEPPGAILLTEGEPGDSLFILTTGWARVYRRDEAGRNHQVGMLEEGDFFGEAALLTGGVRTATVTAASDCELLELSQKTFDELVIHYPRIAQVVRAFHARRSAADPGR